MQLAAPSAPSLRPTAAAQGDFAERALPLRPRGQVYMVVVALDYLKDPCKLSCTVDGDNIQELAAKSGVSNIIALYNDECTCANVEQAIRQMGGQCGPDDTFLFYYTGHGTSVQDRDGDEHDGSDEAYVLVDERGCIDGSTIIKVTPDGQVHYKALMTDDVFSELVTCSIQSLETRIVVLSDCCHSGTVADFQKPLWKGRKAVSISGCRDNQTSGDTGKGGIFTHSMLMAVEELQSQGKATYSVAKLFKDILVFDEAVFNSEQDITMNRAPGCKHADVEQILWPLIPCSPYKAPMRPPPRLTGANADVSHVSMVGGMAGLESMGGLSSIMGGLGGSMGSLTGMGCMAAASAAAAAALAAPPPPPPPPSPPPPIQQLQDVPSPSNPLPTSATQQELQVQGLISSLHKAEELLGSVREALELISGGGAATKEIPQPGVAAPAHATGAAAPAPAISTSRAVVARRDAGILPDQVLFDGAHADAPTACASTGKVSPKSAKSSAAGEHWVCKNCFNSYESGSGFCWKCGRPGAAPREIGPIDHRRSRCVEQNFSFLWGQPICPDSAFRQVWDLVGLSFIIGETYAIPFQVCFGAHATGNAFIVVSIVNAYFIIDIYMSFMTGFKNAAGKMVLSRREISRKYAHGWLIMDIVSGIPWEWIESIMPVTSLTQFTKMLRLLRIARLLRLLRLDAVSENFKMFIEANPFLVFLSGVARVLFMLCGITHWAACLWFSVGSREPEEGASTWVVEKIPKDADVVERYVYSIYYTLTTMTTVGYGDITPQNYLEVGFTSALLLVATVVFATLMGALTDLITSLNTEKNARDFKIYQLSRYMSWRSVPHELFLDVRKHLLFMWETNRDYDSYEEEIKQQLPPVLRMELCYHIYGKILRNVAFLGWMRDYDVCLRELANFVRPQVFSTGDTLFHVGQPNERIWVLIKGTVYLALGGTIETNYMRQASTDEDHGDGDFGIPRGSRMDFATMAHALKGKLHGESHDFASGPRLSGASLDLRREDFRRRRAAIAVQKRWREKMARRTHDAETTKPPRPFKFHSKSVSAPGSFFGEACLWTPYEDWESCDPFPYMYSARCQSRCEMLRLDRCDIKRVIELFSCETPWLYDRFEAFRKATVRELREKSPMAETVKGVAMAATKVSMPKAAAALAAPPHAAAPKAATPPATSAGMAARASAAAPAAPACAVPPAAPVRAAEPPATPVPAAGLLAAPAAPPAAPLPAAGPIASARVAKAPPTRATAETAPLASSVAPSMHSKCSGNSSPGTPITTRGVLTTPPPPADEFSPLREGSPERRLREIAERSRNAASRLRGNESAFPYAGLGLHSARPPSSFAPCSNQLDGSALQELQEPLISRGDSDP